jgi:hypothetical protein
MEEYLTKTKRSSSSITSQMRVSGLSWICQMPFDHFLLEQPLNILDHLWWSLEVRQCASLLVRSGILAATQLLDQI